MTCLRKLHVNLRPRAGHTLLEIVLTVATLATASFLLTVGFKYVNALFKQTANLQLQREAQVTLYMITRDIRNSNGIISINTTIDKPNGLFNNMRLSAFDFERYGYNNPEIFLVPNIGTVTYQFVNLSTACYIQRTSQFHDKTKDQKLLLKDILDPTFNQIFKPIMLTSDSRINTVDITFRLTGPWYRGGPKERKAQVMTRGVS